MNISSMVTKTFRLYLGKCQQAILTLDIKQFYSKVVALLLFSVFKWGQYEQIDIAEIIH